jgi:hypothetical protein
MCPPDHLRCVPPDALQAAAKLGARSEPRWISAQQPDTARRSGAPDEIAAAAILPGVDGGKPHDGKPSSTAA